MYFQKTTGVLLTIFIFSLITFFYLYFFYFPLREVVRERVITIDTSVYDQLNDSERLASLERKWSPEPLVREENNNFSEGLLTKGGIVRETNKKREKNGVASLLGNVVLEEIAQRKLDNMFEKEYFAHTSPSGVGVDNIAEEVGYDFLLIGDNLAKGNYRDDQEVVEAWMDSEGHRRNILDERYEEIGVAAEKGNYQGREVWIAVQVFSMPTSACPGVDSGLLQRIESKRDEIDSLQVKIEELKEEIDNAKDTRGEEYAKKVEEYNSLIEEYNPLVRSLQSLIEDYNNQIRLKKECIEG